MRRISDDGLVKITNLNLDFAPGVSDRTKIAHVAIAANPNLRPLGKRAAFHFLVLLQTSLLTEFRYD